MRMLIAAVLALAAPAALAGEIEDAHKLAMQGRDDYWHCLARQSSRDAAAKLSEPAFSQKVAGACSSERQNYRVSLLDYLTMQYPSIDSGAHLATANRAVESAQQDVVKAFVRHRAPAK